MAKLTELADSAANFLKQSERKIDEDQLRDFLDRWSQGDLDCLQLDLLADMVKARLVAMTAQFHEGQEVKVFWNPPWRKAKIVLVQRPITWTGDTLYQVQFPDGTRAVFDAENIRAAEDDPLEMAARYLNQGGTIEGERP